MWLDTHNNYCIQNSQNRDQPYLPLRWVFYRLNNVATWSHCTVPCLLPLGTASHLCGVQPKILLDFVSMDKKTFNSRGIELSSTLAQISFREKAMTPSFFRLLVCLFVCWSNICKMRNSKNWSGVDSGSDLGNILKF